jgi:hypothetical protein
MKFSSKKKWVSTDGWRGYERPIYAVFGANDTGTWEDSPCPTPVRKKELRRASSELTKAGFHSRSIVCRSSNVFCAHFYLIVPVDEYEEAKVVARKLYNEVLSKDTELLYCVV